jgi:hypothetical protein
MRRKHYLEAIGEVPLASHDAVDPAKSSAPSNPSGNSAAP